MDTIDKYYPIKETVRRGGVWHTTMVDWLATNRINPGEWDDRNPDVTLSLAQIVSLVQAVTVAVKIDDHERSRQPGTVGARFTTVMAELEARFPHPNPFDSTKAPERYALEAIDELIRGRTQIIDNIVAVPKGWIPWTGGHCPFEIATNVFYRTRNGDVEKHPRNALSLVWEHRDANESGQYDIIAYKVAK